MTRPNANAVRRIVISNVFGTYNCGDAALVEVLAREIRAAFPAASVSGLSQFPDLQAGHLPEITWLPSPGRSFHTGRLARRADNLRLQLLAFLYARTGRPTIVGRLLPPAQKAALDALAEADLVVSCAGGFLEDSNPSYLANLAQLSHAVRFGTPTVLAPQSIGPIRSPLGRAFAARTLAQARLICIREAVSERFVREALGTPVGRARRAADLALHHDEVDREGGRRALLELGIDPDAPFIGCSVVRWSFPGARRPDREKRLYEERMVAILDGLHDRLGLPIVLVNQVASDLAVGGRIAAAARGRVLQDLESRSPAVLRGMIARARVFLASRFHSCIFALLEATPTTAIAYLPKTEGIMADLGLTARVHPIERLDPAAVLAQLLRDYADRDAASAEMRAAIEAVRARDPLFRTVLLEAVGNSAGTPARADAA